MLPKVNVQKMNAPKVNVQKMNAPKVNVQKMNAPKVNVQKMNAPKVNVQKMNAPKINVQKMNAHTITGKRNKGSQYHIRTGTVVYYTIDKLTIVIFSELLTHLANVFHVRAYCISHVISVPVFVHNMKKV